jgi:hypothetical protein
MIKKLSVKSMIILAFVALALWFILSDGSKVKSSYAPTMAPVKDDDKKKMMMKKRVVGMDVDDDSMYAPADLSGSINLDLGCSMKAGTGLASSLMPREVASQEDYAQFAPNDILKGQNFLDPRQQVGWPETIGGTIRNGNHDLRVDPPNPKSAYVWNNSTIVPDLMQRNLFCN